jgi:CDP-paratose 2-epimerase
VHAGYGESPAYVVQTNLVGTINALEHARKHNAQLIFLSSSRIYPIDPIRALPLSTFDTRLDFTEGSGGHGWSKEGITEDFGIEGHRSMYGATKLASELLIEEYKQMYDLNAVVYRCGCLAGPWQMGKVDQGFVVLWASRHLYGGALSYMGFGGKGLQVRDLLHVDDLGDLVELQVGRKMKRTIYNVGGGYAGSVSLLEATRLCMERGGKDLQIGSIPETRAADIPWYITDCSRIKKEIGWKPSRSIEDLFDDIFSWLDTHRESLYELLGPQS